MADHDYGVKFGDQQLLVEYPVGSGIFGAPCGITGLTRQVQTNTNDVSLPPCNDPYAVLWLGVDVVSKRMQLTFQGTLADVALPIWDAWSMEDDSRRRVRWYRNLMGDNRGYWEGYAILTDYSEESSDRGRYTNSGTIVFDGQPQWIDIPPAPAVVTGPSIDDAVAPEVGTAYAVTPGVYTGPAPSLSYQWFADGVPIQGANTASYTPGGPMIGKRLYAIETAVNTGGAVSTATLYSRPVVADQTP